MSTGTSADAATARELGDVRRAVASIADVVAHLDPATLSSADAARLVGDFARLERVAAAGRTLAARRVADSGGWEASGHRSAPEWLAATSGTTVSDAAQVLATAARLRELPATADQLRSGSLSVSQAAAVAAAASDDPAAEGRLLEEAGRSSVEDLRRSCRAVTAAAQADQRLAARERQHRARCCRTWSDAEGGLHGRFSLTADAGAVVTAALRAHHERVFAAARQAGRHERPEALHADALVAMAAASVGTEPGRGPTAEVVVRVDHAALLRGHTEAGEQCEIDGVGPVPVATARRCASDAIIQALLTQGEQIIDVRTVGRTIPSRLRVALEARDRTCVVPGCPARDHLEIHHLDPFARGGPTSLANTCRICTWHHDQVTYRGASLSVHDARWEYTPPDPDPPGGPFDDGWRDHHPGRATGPPLVDARSG